MLLLRFSVLCALFFSVQSLLLPHHANRTVGSPYDAATVQHLSSELQTIIDSLPQPNIYPFVLFLYPGTYYGQLSVRRSLVSIVGSGQTRTIFTFNHSQSDPPINPNVPSSVALYVPADVTDINIESVRVVNDMADPFVFGPNPPISNRSLIAPALHTDGTRVAYRYVYVYGMQDTLYTGVGTAYFYLCTVHGRTDFIYGSGVTYFDTCTIDTLLGGHITANAQPATQQYGSVFQSCTIVINTTHTDHKGPINLGRAWKESPVVTFIDTIMPDKSLIADRAWLSMGATASDVCDARFSEYHSIFPDNSTDYVQTHPQSCTSNPKVIIARADVPQQIRESNNKTNVLAGWNPPQLSPIGLGRRTVVSY